MTANPILTATVIGAAAVQILAPAMLADTCCTNIPVALDPPAAMRRDVVR